VTDPDGGSKDRDGRNVYLPPPPSADDGPTDEVKVPRVNPPSRALEAYVREKPGSPDRKRDPHDVWMALVVLIALAAGLAYLVR
jgi:hypothetical protein